MGDQVFEYQMLGRLQSDCEYVIHTAPATRHLWGITASAHIAEMRRLYDVLYIKPEWLSVADIAYYEKELQNLGM